MKNLTNHDKILLSIFLILGVLVFFLGRCSNKTIEKIEHSNTDSYQKTIDSLILISDKRLDTIYFERHKFNSFVDSINNNHKKVKNAIKVVQNFTPDSRIMWRDSVRRANGIK